MGFRFMRTILFFDLPSITSTEKRNYRNFVKSIKKMGFYMVQESVYVKMCIDNQVSSALINKVELIAPPAGNVMMINVTEKQFSQLKVIIGENRTDVITSNDRTILL